jgi:hypothetical protein
METLEVIGPNRRVDACMNEIPQDANLSSRTILLAAGIFAGLPESIPSGTHKILR